MKYLTYVLLSNNKHLLSYLCFIDKSFIDMFFYFHLFSPLFNMRNKLHTITEIREENSSPNIVPCDKALKK